MFSFNLYETYRKRDDQIVVIDEKRMEGGDVDSIALKIQDVTRDDLGNYTCELQNDYGIGISANSVSVDVHCKCIRNRRLLITICIYNKKKTKNKKLNLVFSLSTGKMFQPLS